MQSFELEQEVWKLQKELIRLLLKTGDIQKLRIVKKELTGSVAFDHDLDEIIGSRPDGTPISRQQLNDSLIESEEAIKKGEVISMEELEKESENWLK